MPFKSRLEEVQNIAKLNLAIINVLNDDEKSNDLGKQYLEEVRESTGGNYQFTSLAAIRLESLEDFYWVITGKSLADLEADSEVFIIVPAIAFDTEKSESINKTNIDENLTKFESFMIKADFNADNAIKKETENKIQGLRYWKDAQEAYRDALKLDKKNWRPAIGFAKCLLHLSKFAQLHDFLRDKKHLKKHPDYWLISCQAYRKQNNYTEALAYVNKALEIDSKHVEAEKEYKKLGDLIRYKIGDIMDAQKKTVINKEKNFYTKQHCRNQESTDYNILSIDGGGVRGLLPAFWLAEIEKETKRPISHMFNMIAGTSVGGLIAAGLSCPHIDQAESKNDARLLSSFMPKYSANEIVDLFRLKSSKIFNTNKTFFGIPARYNPFTNENTKYTDKGRSALFTEYFNTFKMSNALTELVIPAYNEQTPNSNYFFTRNLALKQPDKDELMHDALMATTAAPTYFPSYQIEGKGTFVDGGVNLNNPARTALTEALNYEEDKEKIFILSLGTGSFIPDPFKPSLFQSQLFWAKNFHKIALTPQEGNVDNELYLDMGPKNYQRWQVWYEKSIEFDRCEVQSINSLLEMAREYLEEARLDDSNKFNKMIERLLAH